MNGNIKQVQAELVLYQQSCPGVAPTNPTSLLWGCGERPTLFIFYKLGYIGDSAGLFFPGLGISDSENRRG